MSDTPGSRSKAPARPASEILADIERERAALGDSFETLRRDLDEALEAGRQRARDAGSKAVAVAPVVAGLAASAAVAALLIRRRSVRRD